MPHAGHALWGLIGVPHEGQMARAGTAYFIAAFRLPPRLVLWRLFGSGVI